MVNVIQALAERVRQEKDAILAGRIGVGPDPTAGPGVNTGDIPVLGGVLKPSVAALHSLGLAQEGAGYLAKGAAGELGLLAALAQVGLSHDQQHPATQAANAMLDQGPLHPGRVVDAARNGPDTGTAWLAGGLEMAANPLNYTAPLAKAPGALGVVGRLGELINQGSMVPLLPFLFRKNLAQQAARESRLAGLAKLLDTAPETAPTGPLLPEVLGPARPGRRSVPETALPETPYSPGNAGSPLGPTLPPETGPLLPPELGPALPTAGNVRRRDLALIGGKRQYGPELPPEQGPAVPGGLPASTAGPDTVPLPETMPRPTFTYGNPQQLRDLAARLGVTARPVQPVTDLVDAGRGLAPPVATDAVARGAATVDDFARNRSATYRTPAPSMPVTPAADMANVANAGSGAASGVGAGLADRVATIRAVANAPLAHLNAVLADLHNAIYPGHQADFAIPALTGQPKSAFHTSYLTDHPDGNAAEPYLDYLLNRVQSDKRAAARLAERNPLLAEDVAQLAPSGVGVEEQKRLIQSLFKGVGGGAAPVSPSIVARASARTVADARAALDAIIASADNGKMGGELPTGTAFWEKRLGVGPDEARALLDGAVADGRLGVLPDGALAIRPRPTGGDIAAGGGGGGMGLLPYPGGLTGPIGRAIVPAAGAGAGAGIGYLTGDNPEDARANAATGAAIGGAVGAGLEWSPQIAQQVAGLSQGTMYSPTMLRRMWEAGRAAQTEAAASKGIQGVIGVVKAAPGAWRAQAVNMLKQLPQDALARWVTLWGIARQEMGVTGTAIRDWQERIATERATGVSTLDNPVTDILRRVGLTRLLDPARFHEVYGTDFLSSEASKAGTQLNARQSSALGAFFSGATPLPRTNPLTIVAGGIKGRFQPFINAFVQFGNGVQHDAFRYAMAEKVLQRDLPPLAQALTDDLAARGVDVTSLVAKGGYISGDDVAAVAGPTLGRQWDQLLEETVRNGGDRIAFLAGDFREASKFRGEDALGKVVPFVRWPLHYGPVLAEIAAAHPRVALVAGAILAQQRQQAQELGLKGYETATMPISTETPVLGAYARLRLGGQAGTVRLAPVGAVLPFSQALGGVEMPSGDNVTGYERVKALGGAVGLTPTPLIQDAAYVLGQDYQQAGALSRTAGLEGLVRLLPGEAGRLDVPSVGAGLDAARQALAPLTGAYTSEYDPVMRRYAELVLGATGQPLSAPGNRAYLAANTPEALDLYDQAKREVVLAGAAGNATSLISPVSVTARGADAQRIAAAKAGVYTQAQIDGSSPGVAAKMREFNARQVATNPDLGAYGGASRSARGAILLKDWENRTTVLTKYKSAKERAQLQREAEGQIATTAPR